MSYDVEIHDTTLSGVEMLVFSRNYTSNVAPMWVDAGLMLLNFDGKEAGDLVHPLRMAYRQILRNPDRYKAMEPDNDWGSYDGCLDFLGAILTACEVHYKGRLEIDW